jgi:nucleotide-binding universal stress UspA family protein
MARSTRKGKLFLAGADPGGSMFGKILIGFDDSEQARDAVAFANLVGREAGAELIVAGVLPQDPLTGGRDVFYSESDARMERAVQEAAEPVGARPVTVPSPSPARGLHGLAEQLDVDLLVVGSSHHGGIGRAVAGTTAQRLLHGSPCAVAVTPWGYAAHNPGLRVFAVGYDGSPESKEALTAATSLARQCEATVRILSNWEPRGFHAPETVEYPNGRPQKTLRAHCRQQLDTAVDGVPAEVRAAGTLLEGEIATSLCSEAEKGVDVLFIGSRGYGPLRRVLLGSVSYTLVRATPCPLIVVPRGIRETAADESPAPAGARVEAA